MNQLNPCVSLHYVGNMQNTYEKGSLHMKREFFCRFGKTFFGNWKLDIFFVHFWKPKTLYSKLLSCDHNEKLASGRWKNIFHFVTIKFYYFAEKNLGVFSVTYIWMFYVTNLRKKTSTNLYAPFVTSNAVRKATGIGI